VSVGNGGVDNDGILASLHYLFADIIGDDDDTPPCVPENLPVGTEATVRAGIDRLIEYQSPRYAQLYVERLCRFIGKPGVDAALLGEIARLMALRMSYEDPIRIAQLKLTERESSGDRRKFRIDELIGCLPAVVAEPVLDVLDWLNWARAPVSVKYSAANRWGIRRLKIEAGLKRWRRFSIRYGKERVWVERWLHMINRSLAKQPAAALAVTQTADMIQGYGSPYRHAMADWHTIIDGLVKPTFDGVLPLTDLAGAIAEARAAIQPDLRQTALKRRIAEIRAEAHSKAEPANTAA
jgi:hypothetical protein